MSESPRQEADSPTDSSGKEVVECPTCGRTDFKNETGMKSHHTITHGESLCKVERDCEECGQTIEMHENRASNEQVFCDHDCFKSHHRKTVECVQCGGEVSRQKHTLERIDKVFCDLDCKGEYISENNTGKDHPNWKESVEIECETCSEPFYVVPARKHRAKYCSKECQHEGRSRFLVGENAPNWQGGITENPNYGPNWPERRQEALKRDQHRCQRCRIAEYRTKNGLDVHHIIKLKKFMDKYDKPECYRLANDLGNLICLCRKCHVEWEGIPLGLDLR